MKFIYRLVGTKKSAHNRRILSDIIKIKRFQFFISKYYLKDIRYLSLDYLLISYKVIEYHLQK